MKLIDFIRVLLKHKILLMVAPIVMASLAIVLTMNPKYDYATQAVLYTGIASGTSIEMEKRSDYFASNTAFDNLINIIKSRETQEEVGVRLLSQHLMLDQPHEKYISPENFAELKLLVPEDIYDYVVKSSVAPKKGDNLQEDYLAQIVPEGHSKDDYEQTVANLMELMKSSNDNFIYELLNYEDPFYSLDALSKIAAVRVGSSDLLKLSYEAGDAGICQQTLAILGEVCIRKYKSIKENGSDAVVKYFTGQLKEAEAKLKVVEDRLLKFQQDNNIINLYEQSKAVANVKENMQIAYKQKQAELAGSLASRKKLEEKLEIQEQIQKKNDEVLADKDQLGKLNYRIVIEEAKSDGSDTSLKNIAALKEQTEKLKKEIEDKVGQLYIMNNSTEGVPMNKMMPQWLDKVVESEDLDAEVDLMTRQSQEFEKEVEKYAPAGANIKRIERQISVIEEEYLEILRGLNLAKLKFQDTQLSSNLKMVDPPYFPLKPIPSKRKIIIVVAGLFSFIMLLASILLMDFFDNTLKNIKHTEDVLGIPAIGIMPKIFKNKGRINLLRIQERLMEFLMQNLGFAVNEGNNTKKPKVITVISTKTNEGKTTICGNIAQQLKAEGYSVAVLSDSFKKKELGKSTKFHWLYRFLGYQDPRNDYEQPFLKHLTDKVEDSELFTYKVDNAFIHVKDYTELNVLDDRKVDKSVDFIIIELPNILDVTYPNKLIENSDLVLLVCRSNRLWSTADQNVFDKVKTLAEDKIQFFINGVEVKEVESLLGELPRQRSSSRRKIKNILQFQFYSKNNI
ncbi:MAG: hypothetical protein HRU50_10140 [Winogradskyella sp.]|uniref:exopolysaccharide transport family protein n=1 Tax=Winogradskyella sp. TaxID=1883156 RepID=UPI0025DF3831|nr:hypothetical protein [Winogradskyella sp.]NRB60278.1 hypothetical protein [Winogradskyella sp.]